MTAGSVGKIMYNDKRVLLWILMLLWAISFFFVIIFGELWITNYIFLYLFMGILIFSVSEKWLSSMTLFYIMYTISIGGSAFFMWKENCSFSYDPFTVILGGLFCSIIGYLFGLKFLHKTKIRVKLNLKMSGIQIGWTNVLYFSYSLATIACFLYFLKNRTFLLHNINEGRLSAASGNGFLLYLLKLHIMIIPMMYEEYQKGKIHKILFIFLFLFASIQLLVTGFRTPLASMLLIIIIINIYNAKINIKKALSLMVLLFFAFLLYGAYRNYADISSIYKMIRNHMFADAQNLNRVFLTFPNKIKYQHGYTYIINLIMLKPGPDMDYTLWVKQALQMSFSGGGVTPTILGEFYMNFGYPFIYIGMLLLGIVMAKIDNWITKGKINFWKAYVMLQIASSCSGGIANVYLTPLVFSAYYFFIKPFKNNTDVESALN